MSVIPHSPSTLSALIEPHDCHTAHFATRCAQQETAVITAHGEIDAANALEFVEYTLRHAGQIKRLVVDLTGVDFFGTAGFSALHALNVRTAGQGIDWALVPSYSVRRLLRICDPDAVLPVCGGIDAALSAVRGEPKPLLQLVPQSR